MANETVVTTLPKTATTKTTQTYKSVPTITLDKNSIDIVKGESDTFTYNTNSTGTLSLSSSNTNVATLTKADNVVTVNGVAAGSTTAKIVINPTTDYFGVSAAVPINIRKGYRFGYRIKKSESDPYESVEYLYDAKDRVPAKMDFVNGAFSYGDWGDVWFITDNKPLMLTTSGTVGYYLNPNDLAYKADDTSVASEVASSSYNGNAMAQFPLAWFYRYEDDNYYYEIVSDVQWDSNYKAYAHTKASGSIAPYFYWGIYGASGNSSRTRSLSGLARAAKLTAAQEIAGAQANGSGWYTSTWSQREYIRTLCVLIGKSLNTQAVFGNGNCQSGAEGTVLKTGTLNANGQFYGYTASNKQVKVFHIEAFWGDQWDRTAGLINNKGIIYVKMTPEDTGYRVTDVNGYTNTGISFPTASASYISAMSCNEYGMIPTIVNGSTTTYFCDASWTNNSQLDYLFCGASAGIAAASGGAFTFYVASPPSVATWARGSRLTFLPLS